MVICLNFTKHKRRRRKRKLQFFEDEDTTPQTYSFLCQLSQVWTLWAIWQEPFLSVSFKPACLPESVAGFFVQVIISYFSEGSLPEPIGWGQSSLSTPPKCQHRGLEYSLFDFELLFEWIIFYLVSRLKQRSHRNFPPEKQGKKLMVTLGSQTTYQYCDHLFLCTQSLTRPKPYSKPF